MTMNTKQKQYLKAEAHKLKPIILIGNKGLTAAVKNEINRALEDHELIKIRIQGVDKEQRRASFQEICQSQNAELVQLIGSIGVVYRKREEE